MKVSPLQNGSGFGYAGRLIHSGVAASRGNLATFRPLFRLPRYPGLCQSFLALIEFEKDHEVDP